MSAARLNLAPPGAKPRMFTSLEIHQAVGAASPAARERTYNELLRIIGPVSPAEAAAAAIHTGGRGAGQCHLPCRLPATAPANQADKGTGNREQGIKKPEIQGYSCDLLIIDEGHDPELAGVMSGLKVEGGRDA